MHMHAHTHTPHSDLSSIADLQTVILSTFSSQSEEVRSAASYALGECVGVWGGGGGEVGGCGSVLTSVK